MKMRFIIAVAAVAASMLIGSAPANAGGRLLATSETTVPDSSVPDSVPQKVVASEIPEAETIEETPVITLPLVEPIPGCTAAEAPQVVFLGTVKLKDYRSVRFEIDQIRDGSASGYAVDGEIDIRYGLDAQYLEVGSQYLVGAVVDPVLGLLTSHVLDPAEDFGGDQVIGLSETDADCPEFDDPEVTLHPDGTRIEGGVLSPISESRIQFAGAVLIPAGLALGALFVLAALRNGSVAAFRAARSVDHRIDQEY